MSGATIITGGGRWWRATFHTPRMSFMPPTPGQPSAETAYHAQRAASFHRAFDAAREPLDDHLEGVAGRFGLVPLGEPGVDVVLRTVDERGPHWVPGSSGVTVRARAELSPEDQRTLAGTVARVLDRCRRPPEVEDPHHWHLVRWPDGSITDRSGDDPPGWPVPADLPPEVAGELLHRCVELVDAAEADGLIHNDLHPARVWLDEDGTVAIDGYGVAHRPSRVEGAPDTFYQAPRTPAPDWPGIHRAGLAELARQWGPARQSDALDTWLRDRFGPPLHTPERRTGWTIDARIATGAHGVLRPCLRCSQPTLLGSSATRIEGGTRQPLCRRCLDRQGVRLLWARRALVGVLAGGLLLALAWLGAWILGG